MLSWIEDSGSAISYFVVERSEDGNVYTALDTVRETGANAYNFEDDSISEVKPYFYRLKIVSNVGAFVYSNVILIKAANSTKNILVYPNPVQNVLKFNLLSDKKARYNVWINDISGKVLMKLPPPLFDIGNNYFTINTTNLPKGTYTLIVADETNKYVRKFIKN